MTDGSIGSRASKGFFALLGSRLTVTALQFIAFALLASYIGPRGMGLYTTAVAFTALFEVATSLGFRAAVQREVAQHPESEASLIPNLVYLRTGLATVAYAAMALVVVVTGYSTDARDAALVAGVYLLTVAIESFLIPLEVRLKVGWIAIADLIEAVVLLCAFVVLGSMDAEPIAFLWVYVAANTLNVVLCLAVSVVIADFDWRPRISTWTTLIGPAAQIGLAELLIGLYFRLDLLILARFKPAADVGQYGAAVRFLVTVGLIQVLVMTVLGPVLAKSFVEGVDVLARRYRRAVHLMTLVSLPLAVGGAMTAWRVVPTIPGFSEFEGAGRALSILAPSAAMIFLGSLTSRLLVGAHLQKSLLQISAISLVVVVVLNAALIPRFSYIGAAIATTVTEVVVVALGVRAVRRHLGISWDMQRLGRALRGAAVVAVALLPGYFVHPWFQVAFAAIAYAIALLPTGALRWDDVAGIIPAGEGHVVIDAETVASPVSVWRALRPAESCHIEVSTGMAWWLPVAARLAGCTTVAAVDPDGNPVPVGLLWSLFVDEVAGPTPIGDA